ncbi:unnamed protein product [Boreogadus saida]
MVDQSDHKHLLLWLNSDRIRLRSCQPAAAAHIPLFNPPPETPGQLSLPLPGAQGPISSASPSPGPRDQSAQPPPPRGPGTNQLSLPLPGAQGPISSASPSPEPRDQSERSGCSLHLDIFFC